MISAARAFGFSTPLDGPADERVEEAAKELANLTFLKTSIISARASSLASLTHRSAVVRHTNELSANIPPVGSFSLSASARISARARTKAASALDVLTRKFLNGSWIIAALSIRVFKLRSTLRAPAAESTHVVFLFFVNRSILFRDKHGAADLPPKDLTLPNFCVNAAFRITAVERKLLHPKPSLSWRGITITKVFAFGLGLPLSSADF
jgi:hypothetical protein